MIIFPAVDIKGGKAVRLRRGKADDVTVFADDPVQAAQDWQSRGAEWLHVVDLDGAFDGLPANMSIVAEICRQLDIPVQLGGGIRNPGQASAYLEAGVARLIIGTLAMEQPESFASLCREFAGRIGVSIDSDGGSVRSRGWVHDAGLDVAKAVRLFEDAGAAFIIHTDISRDGMRSGVDQSALKNILGLAHVPVIAAGGVASLEDIQKLYPLSLSDGLQGVISGRALYEGSLSLEEANAWLASQA